MSLRTSGAMLASTPLALVRDLQGPPLHDGISVWSSSACCSPWIVTSRCTTRSPRSPLPSRPAPQWRSTEGRASRHAGSGLRHPHRRAAALTGRASKDDQTEAPPAPMHLVADPESFLVTKDSHHGRAPGPPRRRRGRAVRTTPCPVQRPALSGREPRHRRREGQLRQRRADDHDPGVAARARKIDIAGGGGGRSTSAAPRSSHLSGGPRRLVRRARRRVMMAA